MYTRLSLTSLMFGGEPVEIPTLLKTLTEVPMVFESIDEVRYALYDFMDECLRFAKKTRVAKLSDVTPDQMRVFEKQQDYLLKKLAKFNVSFSLYRSTGPCDGPAGSIALIQIHVHTAFIWVSTALSQRETVFDDHVDTFSAIIPLATEFINSLSAPPQSQDQLAAGRPAPSAADTRRFAAMFTFEMYIIAPLYFVAAKCRHPIIRRAALDLLRRNPTRRENLWRANVMAAIAERTMRLEEKHLRPHSQPHSRQPSPPELPLLFPNASALGQDSWGASLPDASFANPFAPAVVAGSRQQQQPFDSFDAAHPPTTSSCSSSSATGSADASSGDFHMPIDPSLFFESIEGGGGSTAHSFSVTPSISSLEDLAGPVVSTPYNMGTTTTAAEADPWSRTATATSSQLHPAPGIALEPATPLDDSRQFILPPSHPHNPSPSHSPQLHPSNSPSLASEGSPPTPNMPYPLDMGMGMGMDLDLDSMPNYYPHQPHHQPHHHQHHHQQHQQYPNQNQTQNQQPQTLHLNMRTINQLSPAAGARSPDAPFDVPERFRVHESVIGPDKEDGTSWVMLFRKLGGLDAEWDVLTEYVAVS
jgi:hypothetical protein